MPNHITNRLTIEGQNGDVKAIMESIKGEKTRLDFSKVIPMPEGLEETGYIYWYDWAIANWGTKWNAYGSPDDRDTDDTIYFETAWSGVPIILKALSEKYPNVKFIYAWADEDTGCNVGTATAENGNVEINTLENSSKEAYDLAFELNPENKEYYQLVNGQYEYVEED